jgi:opacity protein-like surface antigen
MTCRALRPITKLCGAVAVSCLSWTALAQQAPEDTTPPPPTSNSATDEQPPTQALPPCPTGEQAAAPAPTPPPPAPPPPVVAAAPEKRHNIVFAPQEISVTTGGGATNYFGTALNSTTDPGAAWDARVTLGTHSILALEAAYMGSTNNVDMQAGTQHGRLDSHGIDSDLRFQLPTVVQPYVFGGVGYNHRSVTQTGAASNAGPLSDEDNQVTVPAGAGLTGYIGRHATVDLRGTYRFIPDNGLTEMSTRNLHQWIAQAHVGYVF